MKETSIVFSPTNLLKKCRALLGCDQYGIK
nr:MAG TPA: hypothetical protein [Caudoviricetes sp.]